MLRNMRDIEDYSVTATDGIVGYVKDLYFDDESWVVRYLIVDTGAWLSQRRVLISPISIDQPNWTTKTLPVSITREQVQNSPDIDTDKPVSRQHERGYLGYYGYPYYWRGGGLWGASLYPNLMFSAPGYGGTNADYRRAHAQHERADAEADADRHHADDPHLRSGNAIMRYQVHATDGDIGHVGGIIVDEDTWAIRYLIVNTSNWWLGHQVIIAPKWIDNFEWVHSKVVVGLSRQAVKDAPPYSSTATLNREVEVRTHIHHGRIGYWQHEVKHDAAATAHRTQSSAPPSTDGTVRP
jgi:hypothetical protein